MRALEFTAEVDNEHRLQITMPITTIPGPVRVLVLLPEPEQAENTADAAWPAGLAREWAAEWSGPGEDIYSLSDGVEANATR